MLTWARQCRQVKRKEGVLADEEGPWLGQVPSQGTVKCVYINTSLRALQ